MQGQIPSRKEIHFSYMATYPWILIQQLNRKLWDEGTIKQKTEQKEALLLMTKFLL